MPFTIVRNDIVNMRLDAIVNTANPKPVIGRMQYYGRLFPRAGYSSMFSRWR